MGAVTQRTSVRSRSLPCCYSAAQFNNQGTAQFSHPFTVDEDLERKCCSTCFRPNLRFLEVFVSCPAFDVCPFSGLLTCHSAPVFCGAAALHCNTVRMLPMLLAPQSQCCCCRYLYSHAGTCRACKLQACGVARLSGCACGTWRL